MLVEMHDIFPEKYLKEVNDYRNMITSLYSEYDVIVFMARKAICFYKSMIINGLIRTPKKGSEARILSSRALEYNVLKELMNQKVAVIDDVVIKGKSLQSVLDRLETNGVFPDVYVVNCTHDFISEVRGRLGNRLKETYIELLNNNTLLLSQYITQYIEASMCPYNIDQPIYQITFHNDKEALNFLTNSETSNISSTRQKEFNIQNRVMHFSISSCKSTFAGICDLELISIAKIRFLYKKESNTMIAIPFVLLHEMSYSDLEKNYDNVRTAELDEFIYNSNEKIRYENKYKVLYFFLADFLMSTFVSHLSDDLPNASFERLDSNDSYSFSCDVLGMISKNVVCNSTHLYREKSNNNSFEFNDHLRVAYEYIFSEEAEKPVYFDSKGNKIDGEVITVSNLQKHVKEQVDSFDRFLLSNIFDILIDSGILVPSIIHTADGKILRGYKSGEIYKLTTEHFRVFANMLSQYAAEVNRPLFRVEFEKLCVLFFRRISKLLTPIVKKRKYGFDEYGVCYSIHGPRVSSGNLEYAVEKKSSLESKLLRKYMREVGWTDSHGNYYKDMYEIKHHGYIAIEEDDWEIEATSFAIDYVDLHNAFHLNRSALVGAHIYRFNELLTLLSIGYNKRNQLLSLLAELHLFSELNIGEEENLNKVLEKISKSAAVDGLTSGMWKYVCYSRREHPLKTIFKKMPTVDRRMIPSLRADIIHDFDKSEWIPRLINESGELLYRIMYTVYFLCQKYEISLEEKVKVNNNRHRDYYIFRSEQFEDLKENVKEQLSSIDEGSILDLIIELQKQAKLLLEEFEKEDNRIFFESEDYIDWQRVQEEIIRILQEIPDKDEIISSEAKSALENEDEKKLQSVLQKIAKTGANVFTKVAADVTVAYMKSNGMLP